MENRSCETPRVAEGDLAPRFHAAHHLVRDPPPIVPAASPEMLEVVGGELPDHAREQLQRQASELAEHLQQRQRDLEAWEARLNARAASHDAEVRAARLWLREEQERLREQLAACEAQREVLERRADELAAVGATAERLREQSEVLNHRQRGLEQREQDLDRRCRQWGEQASIWERRRDGTEAALRSQAAALEQQRHDLHSAHAATAALHDQLRRELDTQRTLTQRLIVERQHLATLRAELERLRSGVQELGKMYELQRQVWEQEHQEACDRMRRQRARAARYLKDRLATLRRQQAAVREQQLQLNRRHPPREQTAGQWERDALNELATALAQEHEALLRQHEAFCRWSDSRQEELDARAAHLATREGTLRAVQEQCRQQQQVWVDALDRSLAAALTRNVLPPEQDVALSAHLTDPRPVTSD